MAAGRLRHAAEDRPLALEGAAGPDDALYAVDVPGMALEGVTGTLGCRTGIAGSNAPPRSRRRHQPARSATARGRWRSRRVPEELTGERIALGGMWSFHLPPLSDVRLCCWLPRQPLMRDASWSLPPDLLGPCREHPV